MALDRRTAYEKYKKLPLSSHHGCYVPYVTHRSAAAKIKNKTHLSSLDFEFHVILSGRLAVLALFPTVAVPAVANLFA